MKQAAILALPWIALGLTGCPPPGTPTNPAGQPGDAGAAPQAAPAGGQLSEAYLVVIRMASIEVPLGSASASEEIWSYLDEEAVQGPYRAALGRNGFRIGLAKRDSWPDLARIFKRLTGQQTKESTFLRTPGTPMEVLLKENQPDQTIFTVNDDRTISGEDYPPADNLLTLLCTFNQDEPNHVLLIGQPQLRTVQRTPKIVGSPGDFQFQVKPTLYQFPSLTFRLSVPNDGVLLIGPGADARRPSSAARHFLVHDKQGIDFETVLVFIPSIQRLKVQPAPALPAGRNPFAY